MSKPGPRKPVSQRHYVRVLDVEAPELRYYRGLAGLTQKQLADQAQVGISTIQRIERGYKAERDTLDRLARLLGNLIGKEVTLEMLIDSANRHSTEP